MAIIRKNELKQMGTQALADKLFELRKELNLERGRVASGGKSSNPGRIGELKRTIARILTIAHLKKDEGEKKKINKTNMPSAKKTAEKGKKR